MSSYATTTDLAKYCTSKVFAAVTTQQQQAALDAASAVADGYLAAQFTLPITGTLTQDLVRQVCNIAAYDLITQRGYNPEAGADANWRLRYEDAIRWLEQVAAGKVSPALADSSTGPDSMVAQSGLDDFGGPTVITPPHQRGWR